MALVHSTLYRTEKESDVEMELYLSELRGALLQEHGSSDQVAIDFSAQGVILDEKRATACGLIVNELVSNSLLHAFPQNAFPRGGERVSVSLRSDEDAFRLIVSDNGIGMSASAGERGESMGLSLVRSLVKDDLNGVMNVQTSNKAEATELGTCFTIEFPRTGKRRANGNGG